MVSVNGLPATLGSFGEDASHYQHISLVSDKPYTAKFCNQSGCLANEQSKIKFALFGTKCRIHFFNMARPDSHITCRIKRHFLRLWQPRYQSIDLGHEPAYSALYLFRLRYSPVSCLIFLNVLVEKYQQSSEQIMPNQIFKDYANQLFDDTFIVTKVLNGFILGIALISLFTSLLSLSENQLKQFVILKNLGVTHTQLLWLKLTQTATLVGFTTAFCRSAWICT